MPTLPAFCRSCDAVCASPLRAERPGEENTFEVPFACPSCGGSGRVPPRILGATARAVERLRSAGSVPDEEDAEEERPPARPRPDAVDLLRSLRDEAAGSVSRLELRRSLSARAPALAPLAEALPDALGPEADVMPYLRVWAEAVAVLREEETREERAGAPSDGGRSVGHAERVAVRAVRRLLDREGTEAGRRDESEEVERARARLRSTGRNDSCPCGSGEKYKECHWRADLEVTRR